MQTRSGGDGTGFKRSDPGRTLAPNVERFNVHGEGDGHGACACTCGDVTIQRPEILTFNIFVSFESMPKNENKYAVKKKHDSIRKQNLLGPA